MEHAARLFCISLCLSVVSFTTGFGQQEQRHVWEAIEITLQAAHAYENPYADVDLWVQLEGPGVDTRVWGFWDGDNVFKVRVVATTTGEWRWSSGANVDDPGLVNKSGGFIAVAWTKKEMEDNPNRRGFVRTNPDAPHGFIYADGTPFFLMADTWWAAFTWRYPLEGKTTPRDYVPEANNWCFEGGIHWLKKHGFNSIATIVRCDCIWKAQQKSGGRQCTCTWVVCSL